jgi:hypothetical protein
MTDEEASPPEMFLSIVVAIFAIAVFWYGIYEFVNWETV